MTRHSKIKTVLTSGMRGPDTLLVVDLYEDGKFVERRQLPNKSMHYAEDVSENWNNGLIETPKKV
jgi:hypothetical protein